MGKSIEYPGTGVILGKRFPEQEVAAMRSLCNEWEFTPEWYDGFAFGVGEGKPVRMPHTVAELPMAYDDHMV